MLKANLHIHSNCSDGSDSVEVLAKKVSESGLEVVSLTDHDTIDGLEKFESLLPKNIKFIKGVELTCLAEDIKCHLLGYNFNPSDEGLHNLIKKGKNLRRQKLDTRIKYLKDVWNIELTKEESDWLYSRNSVVKTHIANVLVKRGLADDNLSAMKKYLDNCKTGNTRFDGLEAINVIKNAGGLVVWAHPLGGEGEVHSPKEEFLKKLDRMVLFGIQGLECFYSRYSNEEIKLLTETAKNYNLYITGGSDYHGTNKDVPLNRLNIYDEPVDGNQFTILDNF